MSVENSGLRRKLERGAALPPLLAGMAPLWDRLAEDVADGLSSASNSAIAAGPVALSLALSKQHFLAHPEPGLLLPLEVRGDSSSFIRIQTDDLLAFSTELLRTTTDYERDNLAVRPLDAFLMINSLKPLLQSVEEMFDLPVRFPDEVAPQWTWPFYPPGQDKTWLCVEIAFFMGDSPLLSVEMLLPATESAFEMPRPVHPPTNTEFVRHLMSSAVLIAGTVEEWSVDPEFVQQLSVGTVLSLGEASLEKVSLNVVNGRSTDRIADTEHGRAGRRQALRIVRSELAAA